MWGRRPASGHHPPTPAAVACPFFCFAFVGSPTRFVDVDRNRRLARAAACRLHYTRPERVGTKGVVYICSTEHRAAARLVDGRTLSRRSSAKLPHRQSVTRTHQVAHYCGLCFRSFSSVSAPTAKTCARHLPTDARRRVGDGT